MNRQKRRDIIKMGVADGKQEEITRMFMTWSPMIQYNHTHTAHLKRAHTELCYC